MGVVTIHQVSDPQVWVKQSLTEEVLILSPSLSVMMKGREGAAGESLEQAEPDVNL